MPRFPLPGDARGRGLALGTSPPPRIQEPLPFEGQSSYAADYPAKQGEAAVPGGLVAPPRTALPFEGSSRYQEDFGPKQGERYESHTVPVSVPRLPFEGQSSYSADYVPKQAEGPAVAVQLAGRRVRPSPSPTLSNSFAINCIISTE